MSGASDAQRAKVAGRACLVCGRIVVDPAHLVSRALGGCDDPDCVVALCRRYHRDYGSGRLDLLPYLQPAFTGRARTHDRAPRPRRDACRSAAIAMAACQKQDPARIRPGDTRLRSGQGPLPRVREGFVPERELLPLEPGVRQLGAPRPQARLRSSWRNVVTSAGMASGSIFFATSTAEASNCPRMAVPLRGLRICLARTSRSAGGASVWVNVAPTAMACVSLSCCLTSSSSRPVAAAIAGGQMR